VAGPPSGDVVFVARESERLLEAMSQDLESCLALQREVLGLQEQLETLQKEAETE